MSRRKCRRRRGSPGRPRRFPRSRQSISQLVIRVQLLPDLTTDQLVSTTALRRSQTPSDSEGRIRWPQRLWNDRDDIVDQRQREAQKLVLGQFVGERGDIDRIIGTKFTSMPAIRPRPTGAARRGNGAIQPIFPLQLCCFHVQDRRFSEFDRPNSGFSS